MRRTAKQWQALVNKQLRSGQSAEQFCKRRGINAAYFSQVKRKYGAQKPQMTSPDAGFIKLPRGALDQRVHPLAGVQLEFRGARITVPEHYSPIWMADLLKALMP
jgi:hypothetical protein